MLTNACSATPWRETRRLFAREDYVEEAWRIVDPVLKAALRSTNTSLGPGDRGKSIRKFHRQEAGRTRR